MSSPPPAKPARSSYGFTAVLVLLLVAAAGGYYLYERSKNPDPPPVDSFANMKVLFRQLAAGHKLDAAYTDADGDLVADPPTDPARFRPVTTIGFSAVGTGDEER